jgi:hypothetical protein
LAKRYGNDGEEEEETRKERDREQKNQNRFNLFGKKIVTILCSLGAWAFSFISWIVSVSRQIHKKNKQLLPQLFEQTPEFFMKTSDSQKYPNKGTLKVLDDYLLFKLTKFACINDFRLNRIF